MSRHFPLVIFLLAARCLIETSPATFERDVAVLSSLRSCVDDSSVTPGSCLSSWDFSVDPCDSLFTDRFTCGFACGDADGVLRLTELTLDHAGYSASLEKVPFHDAVYLQIIDVSGNGFYGKIPESIAGLDRLTRLVLSSNLFDGPISESIGFARNLEEIFLDNNYLEGKVPSSFAALFSLKRLELQNNKLIGSVPAFSSDLSFFDASNNELTGELSSFPSSILSIILRNNSIEGGLPESLRSLNYLQVLDLSCNRISGGVPSYLLASPSMEQINLANNRFTSIETPPAGAVIQSQLIALDVSGNQIKGSLPDFLGLMPRLSVLSLEENRFSGTIPLSYAFKAVLPPPGVSQFTRLLLHHNYLLGPIPPPLLWLFKKEISSSSSSFVIRIDGNCLFRCPMRFFFCQGFSQRNQADCTP